MPDINVALIGCGMWGRNIARNLQALGCLGAVADNIEANASAFAQEFGCASISVEDALCSDSTNAVAIVTAAPSHMELAVRALQAGKPVFVEKPLALDLEEATAIAQAAAAAGQPVMVGHLIRHHPCFQQLLAMVEGGKIGQLRHIRASRIAPGRVRDKESVLYDLCPHDLALIAALTGHAEPATVDCHGISHITDGVDDAVTAQLEFADGVTASVQANWMNPVKIHNLTVVGSDAALVLDDTRPWTEKLTLHPFRSGRGAEGPFLDRGEPVAVDVPEGEPLKNEMANFIAAAAGETTPLTDIHEALLVQRIMARMQASISSKRT